MKGKNTKLLIIFLVLLISIGFAYLTANLAINATIGFKESSWDVHFASIEVNENSYDLTKPTVDPKNTSLTFNATLNEPGDFYEFTVDVVNAGTMDAALDRITKSTLDDTKSKYIDYSIRYYGNRVIKENDILHAGYSEKLIVRVEYKYDINTLEHLGDIDFSLDLDYVKKDLEYEYGNEVWNIDYSGNEAVFKAPKDGVYKLEVWGAQGGIVKIGTYSEIGGYGGYSSGTVSLSKKDVLYINVGEVGHAGTIDFTTEQNTKNEGTRSYNGGGSPSSNSNSKFAGGGGATHIATVSGELANLKSYMGTIVDSKYYVSEQILIVAGGGGGAAGAKESTVKKGGSAGGYIGSAGSNLNSTDGALATERCADAGNGGTQIGPGDAGYSQRKGNFGLGGYNDGGSGGGGGFFGGNGSWNCASPGGGGSSYIGSSKLNEKSMYCYMCQESGEENIKTFSTANVSAEPISEYAKIGNGYARITFISD